MEVRPSVELAYWVGVAQSDGCITRYAVNEEEREEVSVGVCSKSLPMLEKFQSVSSEFLGRKCKIHRVIGKNEWRYHFGSKSLRDVFNSLDIKVSPIFRPPSWAEDSDEFFGAYLAGLIDGDGDVRIKNHGRQCALRISTGIRQDELESVVRRKMLCNVRQTDRHRSKFFESFGRMVESRWVEVEFYVSRKNALFILKNVLPNMSLEYKRDRMRRHIEKIGVR